MRFDNARCWELAAAPFGPPDETVSEFSSAVFDPTDGSYEAQGSLRTAIPRSVPPATSGHMGDALFSSGTLPRTGDLLLSTLCIDRGVCGEWHHFAYDALVTMTWRWQQEDLDKQLDEARMFGDWHRFIHRINCASSWSPGLQIEPRQKPTPRQYLELANSYKKAKGPEVKIVENALGPEFPRQPIKAVSKVSMMPAPDLLHRIWRYQYELKNGPFTEIRDDEDSLPPLPSAFSDTTAESDRSSLYSEGTGVSRPFCTEPDNASLASSATYASSEGNYITTSFHHGSNRVAPSTADSDGRPVWDEQELAMHEIPLCLSTVPLEPTRSSSESSLMSITPSIAAALAYEMALPLYSALSGSYETVTLRPGPDGEFIECSAGVDDNTRPLRTFFLDDDEEDDEGEYVTEDAGHTPFDLSPVSSYEVPTAPEHIDIENLYHYISEFPSQQTTHEAQVSHVEALTTTSSIEEAETSLVQHYLGEDILDLDLECALLFATHQSKTSGHADDERSGPFKEAPLASTDFEFTFTSPSPIVSASNLDIAEVHDEIRIPSGRDSPIMSSAPTETIEEALERLMDGCDDFGEVAPLPKRRKTDSAAAPVNVGYEVRIPNQSYLAPGIIVDMLEEYDVVDEDSSNTGLTLCRTSSRSDNYIPNDTQFDVLPDLPSAEDLASLKRHFANNLQESFSRERSSLRPMYAAHDYLRYSVLTPSNLHYVSRQSTLETVVTVATIVSVSETEQRALEVCNYDPSSRTATLSPLPSEAQKNYSKLNRLSQITTAALCPTIYGPGEPSSSRTSKTLEGEFHLATPRRSVKIPNMPVRWVKRAVSRSRKVAKKISSALDCTGQRKWEIERMGTFELCDVDPFGVRTHSLSNLSEDVIVYPRGR